MTIRIVGDVHGKTPQYLKLVKDVDYSIQLGDLGFNYAFLQKLDATKHRVIKGNHDNYDVDSEHFLGDGGAFELGGLPFFFIRGERSIDWKYRVQGVDFWAEEELDDSKMDEIEQLYLKTRPAAVLSHGCPSSVIDKVSLMKYYGGELLRPSKTAHFLQRLFEHWRPQVWIFGHYHNSKVFMEWPTMFVCLNELQYIDLEL